MNSLNNDSNQILISWVNLHKLNTINTKIIFEITVEPFNNTFSNQSLFTL